MSPDNYGKIPLHTACTNSATVEVIIQLLLDQFTGDEQHCSGLNIAQNHGQLPIHCYVCGQNVRAETLQLLLDLNPGRGIHVIDGNGAQASASPGVPISFSQA
jgi:hypothetical protein